MLRFRRPNPGYPIRIPCEFEVESTLPRVNSQWQIHWQRCSSGQEDLQIRREWIIERNRTEEYSDGLTGERLAVAGGCSRQGVGCTDGWTLSPTRVRQTVRCPKAHLTSCGSCPAAGSGFVATTLGPEIYGTRQPQDYFAREQKFSLWYHGCLMDPGFTTNNDFDLM